MSHIATLPLVSCHRMSALPSPLKSPVPAMDHTVGSTLPTAEDCMTCAAFMNQIATLPLVVLRHRMSLLPSPSKSRCPTIDHTVGAAPTPRDWTWAPFIDHTAAFPLSSCHRMSLLPSPLKSWVSVSLLLAASSVAELHGAVTLPMLLCVKTTAGNDSFDATAAVCTKDRLFVSPVKPAARQLGALGIP